MKTKFNKGLVALSLCVLSLFSFASCKEVEEDTSFSTPTIDSLYVVAEKGGSLAMPDNFVMPLEDGILATGFTGSDMFGGFVRLSTGKTDYFTTTGSITINFQATLSRWVNRKYAEGEEKEYNDANFDDELMNIAVALFKKDGNNTQYIQTVAIPAKGETHTSTITGLDPAAEYRLVITYTDVSRTRATGKFLVNGVTNAPTAAEVDESAPKEG